MKKPSVILFAAFTLSLLASFFAAFRPDFLRIRTVLFRQDFGIFQTCFREGNGDFLAGPSSSSSIADDIEDKSINRVGQFSYCEDFPSTCKFRMPNEGEEIKLTCCQAWLVLRYTQIAALVFGVMSWLFWTLTGVARVSVGAMSGVMICSLLFAAFELLSSQIVTSLRDDPHFILGGEFGLSYHVVNASWCATLFLVVAFGFMWLLQSRSTTSVVYIPVPVEDPSISSSSNVPVHPLASTDTP